MNVVNSINTNSAGTSNITKIVVNESELIQNDIVVVPDSELFDALTGGNIKRINLGKGLKRFFDRLVFDLYGIKRLERKTSADNVLIMANYSLIGFRAKKIVIMRHPYLVDRNSWAEIKTKRHYLTELIRKGLFRITLVTTDVLIVQTSAMLNYFNKMYPRFKGEVKVVPNPVSKSILALRSEPSLSKIERKNYLLYPSRYYSHKNHELLLTLASEYKEYLSENNLKFIITLDENGEGRHIIEEIKRLKLESVIENIGEIPQSSLIYYYQNSLLLFFPSLAETFGNSLVEAAATALPIAAINRNYSRSLLGTNFAAFENTPFSAMEAIKQVLNEWKYYSDLSKTVATNALDADEWYREVLK